MRRREIDSGQLPDADDTWWSEQSLDERLEFDPSRYFQEAWNVSYVDAADQISQEHVLRAKIEAEKQPRHVAAGSFAHGVLALLRRSAPRHRGGSDI